MENVANSDIALPGHFPDFAVFCKVLVFYEWEVLFTLFGNKEKYH